MADSAAAASRRRLAGRAVNSLVVWAPWLWPLLRSPTRRFFSARASEWDQRSGAGGVEHLSPLAAAVLRVDRAPERVLDIGCGTGAGTFFLAREFPQARVRGVDLSEEMVRAAVARAGLDPEGRVAFKLGDAASLPFPDDSFDLVAQLNMPPFFAEIVRVLRPGGYAIVGSSWGAETPFYTRPGLLRWKFLQHGVEPVEIGQAGAGSFYVGRLADTV